MKCKNLPSALMMLVCVCGAITTGNSEITIELVNVGNAGNSADPSTGSLYGAVSYDYAIGKYEVTIGQYTAFLNAVAATDTYGLYNSQMGTNLNIAGIRQNGSSGNYTYSVMNNAGSSANRPITYVSWFDAARFANWIANGQPTGPQGNATTENGAYALNKATSGVGFTKNRLNPNTSAAPAYWIPSESEWYKAAYYDPNKVGGAGYWLYPMQSDTAPGNLVGSNGANYRNAPGAGYSVTQNMTWSGTQNYLTSVGSFNAASHYGTYDQGGNAWEWNDAVVGNVFRGIRGGSWDWDYGYTYLLSSYNNSDNPNSESYIAGFRLASVPKLEPPSECTVSVSGADINIRFGTIAGQTYAVEKSTTLAQGSWTEILGNVTGTGTVQTTTDAGAGSLPKCFYRIRYGVTPPIGMALIPPGSFSMGDALDRASDAPVHTVSVSAFYMEKYEVTKALWDEVRAWGLTNGYTDLPVGAGKAANHPVQTITWYAVVKWCNARSEKEGLKPCYTVSGAVYKTTDNSAVVCNMSANGYRLPTEAEWEKAARGGLIGKRFPWGDTISQSQANYYGSTSSYSYDLGPNGYNPTYNDGVYPYTSPAGSFGANGYGLYDMAGNVMERCWDWYGTYGSETVTDPTGPGSGSFRVLRGSSWNNGLAISCRVSDRRGNDPTISNFDYGFRCARSSVP